MKKHTKKRSGKVRSGEDWIIDAFVTCFMIVWAFISLYPLVYCVSMSLSEDEAIIANTVKMFPKGFSLDTFKIVFGNKSVVRSFGYAVLHTVVITVISVSGTMLYGYVYSRKRFVLKGFLVKYTLLSMLLGGGMIPFFMQIKRMGLYNSYWALWLPAAVNLWNAMIAKSFFDSTV
ncbi:MAG: carbohydrate ABC transporter permease, partial [Firmicutes bacterium]|nr:carbohydrate ABC transporter permease [Bacillota bacterium]